MCLLHQTTTKNKRDKNRKYLDFCQGQNLSLLERKTHSCLGFPTTSSKSVRWQMITQSSIVFSKLKTRMSCLTLPLNQDEFQVSLHSETYSSSFTHRNLPELPLKQGLYHEYFRGSSSWMTIQDLDVINFFICRVQPSITLLHHVIPSFPESILLGFISGASFTRPSIFTFSSTVIILDHKVHSPSQLTLPWSCTHTQNFSKSSETKNKSHITFWWWQFIVTYSCRYQHPAYMLTHLPKI